MGANQAIAMVKEETSVVDSTENQADSESEESNPEPEEEVAAVDENEEAVASDEENADSADQTQETEQAAPETEEPEESVAESETDTQEERSIAENKYKVIAGCFQNYQNSDRRVALLQSLGYPAVSKQLNSNYHTAQGLNSVIVNRYPAYDDALSDITALRDDHSIDSYLIKRGRKRYDGKTAYISMDISDPTSPKETNIIQWILE